MYVIFAFALLPNKNPLEFKRLYFVYKMLPTRMYIIKHVCIHERYMFIYMHMFTFKDYHVCLCSYIYFDNILFCSFLFTTLI